MLKESKLWISGLIGIVLGIFLCVLFKKYTVLKINNDVGFEVNPLEIFSLLINVFLAIYITKNLSKQNESEKSQKDIFVRQLEDYKNEFSEKINFLLEKDQFETITTNHNFKILRSKIASLVSLSEDYNFIPQNEDITNKINQKVTDIWELFTDTPKKANPNSAKGVKEDIERICLERRSKIEFSVIEFNKLMFQLIMKINNK